MRQVRFWVVVLVLGLWAWPSSFGQATMSKEDKVKKLMQLTQQGDIAQALVEQTMSAMAKSGTNMPAGFIEEYKKEFSTEKLNSIIVPIYAKYFTMKELDDVISFYESETGRKMSSVLPQLMVEISQAGQDFAIQAGQRVMEKLKEKGK